MEITKYDASSYLPEFILWFIFIYILGYFTVFKNWSKVYRAEAASCLMSLSHGTVAFVLSILAIFQSHDGATEFEFASENTSFQNMVLEYSIAYFLMDLLHYTVIIPGDVLFIAHHIATLYVLMTCRYLIGVGAVAILGVLFLAEATTTCQNTWSLARYRKADSTKAAEVLHFLSPYFYAYYSVVRGILGPLFVYKIGLFFSSGIGDGVIPKWTWISWIVVIVASIGVSILWIMNLWIEFYRERIEKKIKSS